MHFARSLKYPACAAVVLLAALSACRLTTTGQTLSTQANAPVAVLESTLGPLNSEAPLSHGSLVLVFYRGHW